MKSYIIILIILAVFTWAGYALVNTFIKPHDSLAKKKSLKSTGAILGFLTGLLFYYFFYQSSSTPPSFREIDQTYQIFKI